MHVAHFIQRYPPALGGAEAYFARLSRYLAAHGEHVSVFTSNAVELSAFWSRRGRTLPAGMSKEDGIDVHRFACWRWPGRRYVLKLLSFFPSRAWQCLTMPASPTCPGMWRAARTLTGPIDVVHATALPYAWPLVCARRLARRRGVPFLITPFLHLGDLSEPANSTRRQYTAPHLRWLLHEADLLFAQTESERQALIDLGIGEERVVLQGLGVDFAECTGGNRELARSAWGAGPDGVVVGLLANQSVEKGSVDLLQALTRVWHEHPRIKAVLAGPEMPNFLDFWKTFAGHAPAGAAVRLGVLDDQQKRDFFAGIDVFALPSRSDSFGLVLLEAWANGCPTIGYRAGGIADVIRHEEDGLLVRCGDLAALAEAIRSLAANASWRRQLGESGQQRAAQEYRWADKLALAHERMGTISRLHRIRLHSDIDTRYE